MSLHKIEVKPIDPKFPISGKNCQILIDGRPLEGVTDFRFGVAPGELGAITIKMLGPCEIGGTVEVTFAPEPAGAPWVAEKSGSAFSIYAGKAPADSSALESRREIADRLDEADAKRIVACVNALAGIRYPEALPELLEALAEYQNSGRINGQHFIRLSNAHTALAAGLEPKGKHK
ncbi:MAG: hypothetical protein WC130_04925 [Kiritimatiellia bacterium]